MTSLEQALLQNTNPVGTLKSALKNGSVQMSDFAPPSLIRELFNSKRAELAAKQKLRLQLQTEVKLRQQLTNQMQDEMQNNHGNTLEFNNQEEPQLLGGFNEDIVGQLMAQNANILSILQDGASLAIDGCTTADETQD